MTEVLIRVEGLRKEFRQGFFMRRVVAVRGISFQVERGDIFGFLGPNGAGKTTTIKILTSLIRPSAGTVEMFQKTIPSADARARIGYLPENPYIYPYLTPTEFVELSAGLAGLSRKDARSRTRAALERVGILYAADRQVRRLSKGMLQRTALAAALVADPELLILDEPMSGLDPVGRKEVRDLMLEERRQGRTIFFSTHILSDVETLCDRVSILRKGEVVVGGRLGDLLKSEVRRTDIVLEGASAALLDSFARSGHPVRSRGERVVLEIEGQPKVAQVIRTALESGATVSEVMPRHETLEELFVREAIDAGESARSG